jgi:hypothetical protein
MYLSVVQLDVDTHERYVGRRGTDSNRSVHRRVSVECPRQTWCSDHLGKNPTNNEMPIARLTGSSGNWKSFSSVTRRLM